MNKDLLKEVKKKQEKRNIITESDYQLKMSDFILKIYNVCTPSKYGAVFPGKIQQDVGHYLKSVTRRINEKGDLHINNKEFFEVKISYLGQNNKYRIANIRDWQNFNYFILCFVSNDFKPSFYCVPKKVITDNPKIKLTGMNNSMEVNSHNTYVGKATTIHSYDVNYIFKKTNVLKGTSYTHLLSFLKTFKNKN